MSFKYPVVMPKMSMTMETGELINFHVAVGDQVKSGDVLFEVMTDKIDMEVVHSFPTRRSSDHRKSVV